MQKLRPTVKRDLSLFSIEAWEKGYRKYLPDTLGWDYPIIFHYDGTRVHFYHTEQDFSHFKHSITQRLINDDALFEKLNEQFKKNIFTLREFLHTISGENLQEISDLIGTIMAFYIFVVSDAFVATRASAWESRTLSEGILYDLDEHVERHMKQRLREKCFGESVSHVLRLSDYEALMNGEQKILDNISHRLGGYIIRDSVLSTDITFETFCSRSGYVLPEIVVKAPDSTELRGTVAYQGTARGRVKIVHRKEDLATIKEGDILVACMTNATYIFGMKMAGAIVTDEGGITCHAAIMARELGKPCITGTREATKRLKDGDSVVVDAYQGIVKICS
ncbi:MAG: PEP-utilizing enzyme [Patescibacteria group bacterium]